MRELFQVHTRNFSVVVAFAALRNPVISAPRSCSLLFLPPSLSRSPKSFYLSLLVVTRYIFLFTRVLHTCTYPQCCQFSPGGWGTTRATRRQGGGNYVNGKGLLGLKTLPICLAVWVLNLQEKSIFSASLCLYCSFSSSLFPS